MATLIIGTALPFDMRNPQVFYGTALIATQTQIEIASGGLVGDYFGQGFTYSQAGGVVGGTLTGYSDTYYGRAVFTATGLNVPAATAYQLVQSGNVSQLDALALSGNDTIYGAGDSDVLIGYGGNNTFVGKQGGVDYVAYSGAASAYTVTPDASGPKLFVRTAALTSSMASQRCISPTKRFRSRAAAASGAVRQRITTSSA